MTFTAEQHERVMKTMQVPKQTIIAYLRMKATCIRNDAQGAIDRAEELNEQATRLSRENPWGSTELPIVSDGGFPVLLDAGAIPEVSE